MFKNPVLCVIPFFFLSISGVCQVTVTLNVTKDAALGFHDGTNAWNVNYGMAPQNAAFWIPGVASPNGTNGNRAIIDFNTSSIPSNATVLSASLNLYAMSPMSALPGHVGPNNAGVLCRIIQNWTENTVTWNTQPSFTTTNQVILPSTNFPATNYLNINVTALVQDMVNNPLNSHGFLLKLVSETWTNALCFVSKDNPNNHLKPTLVVTYELCSTSVSASVSPAANVCAGNQVTLSVNGQNQLIDWYATQNASSPVFTGPLFKIIAPTVNSPQIYTYYASYKGCQNYRAPVTFTVYPKPTLVLNNENKCCEGQPLMVTASGALTYTWSNAANGSTVILNPHSSGIYTVAGTGAGGCINTASVVCSIIPSPILNLQINPASICPGHMATITVFGAPFVTINESNNVISFTNSVVVFPAASTFYSATGTSTNNCSATVTKSITVTKCTSLLNHELTQLKITYNQQLKVLSVVLENDLLERVALISMNGQEYLLPEYEGKFVINTFRLPAGVYVIRALTKHKTVITKKVVLD